MQLLALRIIQAIPKGMEQIHRGLAQANESHQGQGNAQPGEDQQNNAERQADDRTMFGRLPDAGGDGLHLGWSVDGAAFAERFRA